MKRIRENDVAVATDHETRFSCDEQAATIDDAKHFVKYMASPELFDIMDMNSISPMEGLGYESNLRMHTTRLITNHMREMSNKALGVDLYDTNEVSTLYRETGEPPPKKKRKIEDDVTVFGSQYKAHQDFETQTKQKLMKYLSPSEPITEQNMTREIITIKHETKPLHLKIRIDNYVFVTYLCNKNEPRKRCKINLLDMAAKTLAFGTQHSRNKFAKNDLRYRWGSHLVFESGVLIETGCTSSLLAAKLLEHTMNIFKYVCGYLNIGIWERRCENVVATGCINFGICLELLKDRYHYVTYEKANFAGAIICIKDINAHKTNTSSEDEFVNYEKNHANVAEEYNRKYNHVGNEAEQREHDYIHGQPPSSNQPYEVTYDECDMLHILRSHKEKNVKALVFPGGRVICVGNKSREGVIESFSELFPILESCRDTPENIEAEKLIIRTRRYNYSKKRKREAMETKDSSSPSSKKRKGDSPTMINCRYCDFVEPYANYKINKSVCSSDMAIQCDECNQAVCRQCLQSNGNDYYNGFVCHDCMYPK